MPIARRYEPQNEEVEKMDIFELIIEYLIVFLFYLSFALILLWAMGAF